LFVSAAKYESGVEELIPQYAHKDISQPPINAKLEKIKDTHNRIIIDADLKCLSHGLGRNTITIDNTNKSSSSVYLQRKRCTRSHVKENSIGRIEEASRLLRSKDPHPSKLISKKKLSFAMTKPSSEYAFY
jgi:hypothetical protein